MKTRTITASQLGLILAAVKGAQPIAFSALVDARARKTGNPFGEISKLSRVQAFTGFDYVSSIRRQEVREGKEATFEAQEHRWGTRIAPCVLKHDKTGELYLVAKIERSAKPIYIVRSPKGFLTPVSKETVLPYLPAYKPAANQGTEKEIVYRNYALQNLVSLSMGGQRYRIRREKQIA